MTTEKNQKNSIAEPIASDAAPKKETILSGIQPTGRAHLGNLEGAIRNWMELQNDYWMYLCIVDLHALTAAYQDTKGMKENVYQMAIDMLATGIDPDKCAIFIQSEVKEHAELHLIFSMLVTVPTLTRMPTYQDKKDKLDSYGFLGYPVLQAADICLYNANKVPVGKDQEKHIWLSADVAQRFNTTYKKVFNLPETLLREIPLILGSDGRKMSKSYNNHIPIDLTDVQTEKLLKKFITDPQKVYKGDPGNPDICPIYLMHRVYTPEAKKIIAPPCRTGELGCVDCKMKLAKNLNTELAPIRARRAELVEKADYVWDVLATGRERARQRASSVMERVLDAMKLNYRKTKKK